MNVLYKIAFELAGCLLLLLLLPDPFQGMGAWQKTMEPQKLGNSPGSGTEVEERDRESPKSKRRRVRCWTVQNDMRGVLGRVPTGATGRILDSANPRKIRASQKAVSVAA